MPGPNPYLYLYDPVSIQRQSISKSFQSLEEVQVTHVKWWVFGNSNLVIIKYCPPTILADMGNIVTTVGGSANVAHNSNEFISCKRVTHVAL